MSDGKKKKSVIRNSKTSHRVYPRPDIKNRFQNLIESPIIFLLKLAKKKTMATSKKQLEIAQTKLKEIKKKYPVGIYDSKEFYTVKVLGHKIGDFGGEDCLLTELYYTNNPHYGKSVWSAILMIENKSVTKHFLDKGKYKLRK